jgi:hypothetical protein
MTHSSQTKKDKGLMTLKNRDNESSKADAKLRDDFGNAAKMMAALLKEFDARDMNAGPALGGALTQIITHLINISPDVPCALGLLSSCIAKAAYQSESPTPTPTLFIPDPDGLIH